MSVSLIKQIRDDRDPRLTAPLKFTLMTVATYHSEKHPENGTTVSNRRLADDMGVDIRTVQRHLNTLAIMGKVLIADTKHSKRRGKVFVLTTPASRSSDTSVARQATPVSLASDTHVATRDQGSTDQVVLNKKNIDPSGAEEKLEGHMPVYGSLDESAEMPEDGKTVKPKKKFESAPKAGTHPWLIYRFGQEQRQHNCGRGFMKEILHSAFKELRDDGYSNEDIEVMIRAFFSQNEQDIRAKMADIDVARMFRARMHSLKTKARGAIKAEKTGSRELSRNINRRIKEQLNG